MTRTLIIDDENDICFLISEILNDENFTCETANDSNKALDIFNTFNPELIILDVWLGKSELDGIQLLKKFKDLNPFIPIIIISGHGTVDMAVNAIKNGAYDFIEKPFNSDKIIVTSKRAIESAKLIKENNKLKSMMKPNTPLIGDSVFVNQLKKDLNKIAASNSRVFLSGPYGSGKKLISQLIHEKSIYSQSFCTIIDFKISSEEKMKVLFSELENELSENILIQSNNTTLILDNIDYLNINYQKKLLFFLESKNLFKKNNFDIKQKIISLSSKDMKEEIQKGNFIQTLYDRLSAINLEIPPIKSRRDDIIPILQYYLDYYNADENFKFSLSKNSNAKLELYSWPGNIPQIINYAEKTIILNQNLNNGSSFEIENLPTDMGDFDKKSNFENNYELSLKEARVNFEKDYLLSQIKRFNGNIVKISTFTGMERTALYRKLKSLNIDMDTKK